MESSQEAIRFALIEDEYYTREDMKMHISRLRPNWILTGEAEDIEGTANILKANKTDILFADILLCDGKSTDIFAKSKCKLPIVFITENQDYQKLTNEFNTIDFCLKPINNAILARGIERFENNKLKK